MPEGRLRNTREAYATSLCQIEVSQSDYVAPACLDEKNDVVKCVGQAYEYVSRELQIISTGRAFYAVRVPSPLPLDLQFRLTPHVLGNVLTRCWFAVDPLKV